MRSNAWKCLLAMGLLVSMTTGTPAPGLQSEEVYHATVRVTDRVLNRVNPLIFGDNIEWVNNGMGVWLPKERKFDEKLVQELREAGVTHLRYPGGSLSDYFDWRKAVGAVRQPQPNPFDKGKLHDSVFGPEEFRALCRKLNIPGYITLNAGTGTPEMAAEWVKFCRDKKFKITAFEVGNEVYMIDAKNEAVPALPIAKTPKQYVDFFLRCREAIEKVAPGTRMGAIGLHDTGTFPLGKYPGWMKEILSGIGNRVDFVAIHNGYAPAVRSAGFGPQAKRYSDDEFAACFLGASVYVRDNIAATKALLAQHAPDGGRKIDLQITEYGPLVYALDEKHTQEDLLWNRSLAGALYLASLFNVLLREPKVTSANHLPLCQDGYGALIGIRGGEPPQRKTWRNVVFHVFRAYTRMAGRETLDTAVTAPAYTTQAMGIVPALKEVPMVDAGAYRTKDGKRLTLFLINRDVKRSAEVKIDPGLAPFRVASVTTLAADSYLAENTPENPNKVLPKTDSKPRQGDSMRLPRHSLTVIEFVREAGKR
jgi:alpha-L-arabinofuranosidase